MTEAALSIRGLRKSYGRLEAVRGVDLSVARGEVFALLGPNGAGKTTTVEILEGYRQKTAGEISVLGFDPATGGRKFRERIGIVLQSASVQLYLTVAEAIDLYRGYYPKPRDREELIALVGLQDKADERVMRLSGGLQRRLDVAVGLAGDPELLFLDEPTTGFDPSARRGAWQMIRDLKSLGKTVFLTTHYMDEAQALADRVAIIVEGKIVAEGPPSTLAGRASGPTSVTFTLPAGGPALPDSFGAVAQNGRLRIETTAPTRTLHELTAWALAGGVELGALEVSRPSLEDVYLELTKDPVS